MEWIFWAIVGAAVIHVAEEYLGNWVGWVQRFAPRVTLAQFVVVNAAFVALCIAGAVVGVSNLVFSLSVASLIFVNALIHLAPTINMRRYSPGAASALVLYVPLAVYAYYLAARSGRLTLVDGVRATLLGMLWMALPAGFQLVRLHVQGRHR
jgi:hypothetical protein